MTKTTRVLGASLGALALTVSLAACGGDSLEKSKDGGSASADSSSGAGGAKGSLVIGAAGFTESNVLAELYAQVLKDAGYSTSIKTVNNRELYEPSLEKGEIDVVPEYAATLAEFLNAKVNGLKAPEEKPVASSDVAATVAGLEKLAGPLGLKALTAGEAVDQNAFAVTKEFAEKNNLKTLSDLGKSGLKVKIAAGDECNVRPFCAPGLTKTYGIQVSGIDPKGVGTPRPSRRSRTAPTSSCSPRPPTPPSTASVWSCWRTTRSSRTPTTSCRWSTSRTPEPRRSRPRSTS